MTIDIGNGRGDASVLQNDETVMRTQNETNLTIEQDSADQELVFKPTNPTIAGRMSLKGALPKTGNDRANLRDEPFVAGGDEEAKTPAAASN